MKYLIQIGLISSFLYGSTIQSKVENYLFNQFSDSIKIQMNIYKFNNDIKSDIEKKVKQKFYRNKLYYWSISNNDSTFAHAFIDNVLGKSMPITFLVIINTNGRIINTSVIKYREAYGGEVGNELWLSQFINKNCYSNYTVGQDIDGISGATISVRSMTKGIQKISKLYYIISNQLK